MLEPLLNDPSPGTHSHLWLYSTVPRTGRVPKSENSKAKQSYSVVVVEGHCSGKHPGHRRLWMLQEKAVFSRGRSRKQEVRGNSKKARGWLTQRLWGYGENLLH